MSANVKVGANTSSFQKQMSDMTRQLKVLSSQFNLSTTQAKLFGKTQDQLKAKQAELTAKIRVQNSMVELQQKVMGKLTGDLDKQKLKRNELNKKIEETSKKYQEVSKATGKDSEESKKLKDELNKLKESYAQNEKAIDNTNKKLDTSQIKMNNVKKSVMENEKALEGVNKKLKNLKLENVSGKLNKVSKTTGSIANKLKPLAIGLVGAGVVATKFSMDFSDGLANINTLLDDDSHLKGYKNEIIDVSNQTGMELKTVTDGMYTAISSIGDGGKKTEEIFNTMAKSAKAGGATVDDSVALISSGMKGYGSVSNKTAKEISDLAFQTAKLGVTTFPEMAKSMQPLFPLASGLNVKMTDLYGSMATLTGVTGNTSEVSTQLKAVFSNLMKPTTDMQKTIKKYGYSNAQAMIKTKGLTGVLKIIQKETGGQADKMGKLFSSTEATTAMMALCGKNFNDFTTKTKAMEQATGATDKALAKINKTTGNDLRVSINKAKNSLIGFGDVIAPFVSIFSNGLSKITNAFNSMNEGQKKVTVGIGAFTIGFTGLFFGISKFTGAMSEAITNYGKIKNALVDFSKITKVQTVLQWLLNTATAAFPYILIIAGIGLLVAGFIHLWKTSAKFRNFWIGLWNGIKEACHNAINWISKKFDDLGKWFNSIPGKISSAFNKMSNYISSTLSRWGNNISTFFTQTIPTTLSNAGKSIANFFTKTIPNALKYLWDNYIYGLPNKILFGLSFLVARIISDVVNLGKYLAQAIPNMINSIVNWFSQLPGRIWTWLTTSINNFMNWGMQMQQKAYQYGYQLITNFINWVSQLPGRFWNWLTTSLNNFMNWGMQVQQKAYETGAQFINNFITWVSQLPGRFWNWLVQTLNNVANWGYNLINTGRNVAINLSNSIIDGVKSLPSKMMDIGRYIVEGLWQGIINVKDWFMGKIRSLGDSIVSGFKAGLDIHSPARKMIPIGDFTIQGVDVGMNKAMPKLLDNVKDKMSTLTSRMKATINNEMPDINGDIENNFSLKTNISKDDLNNINSKLNTKTNNKIIVLVENNTILDGEVIGTKTYKKVAKKMQGDENSYKVTKGKRGYTFA